MKSDRIVALANKFEVLIRLSNKSSFTILFSLIIKKVKKQECNPVAEIKINRNKEGRQKN